MRRMRIFGFTSLIVILAAAASFAQTGLVGAPAPLWTSPAEPVASPYVPYPAAAAPCPAPAYAAPAPTYPAPAYAAPAHPAPAYAVPTYPAPTYAAPAPAYAAPAYSVPAYPATTRPVQTPSAPAAPATRTAMFPSRPSTSWFNPRLAAAEPTVAPVAAPSAAGLVEPPEAPVAAPMAYPVAGDSPSDKPAAKAAVAQPAPAAQGNLMNDMLAQPAGGANQYVTSPGNCGYAGCGCAAGYCGAGQSSYAGACGQFEQTACGADPCRPCPWYGSVALLTLGRDRPNGIWTSYQSNYDPNQLLKTRDVEGRWQWGGEVTLGRRFCCGCNSFAVEATYWTLDPSTGERVCTSSPSVSTPLTLYPAEFGADDTRLWFDGADVHRVRRTNEFHNVEVNFLALRSIPCEYQPIWGLDVLMGFRFFRFEEGLEFASVRSGGAWSVGEDWAAIADRIENNLWGFQIGVNADVQVLPTLRVFCTPKFGIYNNHIENHFAFCRGDGVVADTGIYPELGTYPVSSKTDVISFLTEVNLGLDWQFARCWSARIGYRLIAATGIGLADNQIPPYIVDIPEIARIDTNGQLILHGAFAGLTYNY